MRILSILLILGAVSAYATDCKLAKSRNEKLMCVHSTLIPLDVQMRKAIKELKKTSSLTEHREWLHLREAWCKQDVEADRVRCLERATQARIKQLREPVSFPYLALYYDYAPHLVVKDPRVVPELKLLVKKDFDRLLTHYEQVIPNLKGDDIFEGFLFKGWTEADGGNGVEMILTEEGELWVVISVGKVWHYYSSVATSKGRPPATFINSAGKWKEKYGEVVEFKMRY